MPVYSVIAREMPSGYSEFDFERDEPLKRGDYIRNEETRKSYEVTHVRPDPKGRYDALVEADWRIGPAVT